MTTDAPPVVLPAPTFRTGDGDLADGTTKSYARKIAATWIRQVIVSGPMGRGEHCTPAERAHLLDMWLSDLDPARLVAACWGPEDISAARARGVRSLVMLRADTTDELIAALDTVPPDGIAYANPRYSDALITPEVLRYTRLRGWMPASVKLSKVTHKEIGQVRQVAGSGLTILHGSSRDIAGSLAAGANLVTAAPLAALADDWPAPHIAAVQRSIDGMQDELDQLRNHDERVNQLTAHALAAGPDGRKP